jgi:hypothetical protein
LQDFLQHFGYLQPPKPDSFATLRAAAPALTAKEGAFDQPTLRALTMYQHFHALPVTGVLDAATIGEMSKPRCGVPDVPIFGGGRFVAPGNRWEKMNLTYRFFELSNALTKEEVKRAIRGALNLWTAVTKLKFREVKTGSADIEIRFVSGDHGDGNPFDGVGRVLAHAFFPLGGELAGDMHFDASEPWVVDLTKPGVDLITVAAHELGHSLGLDHSSVRGALMFPTYSGPQRFLDDDDVQGIQFLYGPAQVDPDNPFWWIP